MYITIQEYNGTGSDSKQSLINLCLVNQGSQVRFPASLSLWVETLSRDPVFRDALKSEPLPV